MTIGHDKRHWLIRYKLYFGPMKRFLSLCVLLACLAPFAQSQTAEDSAVADLPKWLPPGKHLVHTFLPSYTKTLTPEQTILQDRVVSAFQQNAAWVRDSMTYYAKDSANFYATIQRKIGISQQDFEAYSKLSAAGPQIQITGQDTLQIFRNGQRISFFCSGKLYQLDSLQIDLASNTAQFGQKTLTFHEESKRKNTEGPFGPAKGYQYEFQTYSLPARSDSAALNVSAMTMENYSLGVLRLANTGQIYIIFTGVKMLAGKLQFRIVDTAILD
jgi:hypothetical protein